MEAAVFRRISLVEGERLSFGVVAVAALENHPNGVDFCLGFGGGFSGTGCGEGARASDFRLAAGPAQGTDGNDAEKFPNLDGRGCAFGGRGGGGPSLGSKLAAMDLTDRLAGSVVDALDVRLSAGGIVSAADKTGFKGSAGGSSNCCSTCPVWPLPFEETLLLLCDGTSDSGAVTGSGLVESVGDAGLESNCESFASSKFCIDQSQYYSCDVRVNYLSYVCIVRTRLNGVHFRGQAAMPAGLRFSLGLVDCRICSKRRFL